MRGDIDLDIIDAETGELVASRPLGRNLLLTAFDTKLSLLLAGYSTGNYVDRMQFGTGSALPTTADTTLQMPVSPIKAAAVDHPTSTTTRFTSYLLQDEANGFPISEAGLLAVDDTVVARKVFSGQTKTSNYIFAFKWTISA